MISRSEFESLRFGDIVIWWPPKNRHGRLRTVLYGPADERYEKISHAYVHFSKLARGTLFNRPSPHMSTGYEYGSMKNVLTWTGVRVKAVSPDEIERLRELRFDNAARVAMNEWRRTVADDEKFVKWHGYRRIKCGKRISGFLLNSLLALAHAPKGASQ